jgi:hypothetical protein
MTIANIVVDSFGNGASFALWPSFTLAPGQGAILTATAGDNFDTSDQPLSCNPSSAIPEVHFTVNGGSLVTLSDTGQRLNTGGTDIATCPANSKFAGPNESIGWDVIGHVGGQGNQTPEPASLLLLGTGILSLCGAVRKKLQA